MYARDGVEMEAGFMGHWLASLTWLLNPLVGAVCRHAPGGAKVHADDTTPPVLRQEKLVPLLEDIKRWFEATNLTLSAKPHTTKAPQYSLNRWPALFCYCEEELAEIDNQIAERALREWQSIGRQVFLFASADSGGKRADAIYSLIGSAWLNGMVPKPTCIRHCTHRRPPDDPIISA